MTTVTNKMADRKCQHLSQGHNVNPKQATTQAGLYNPEFNSLTGHTSRDTPGFRVMTKIPRHDPGSNLGLLRERPTNHH